MSKQFTLTAVKALADGVLALTYADGEQLQVDVKPIIAKHPTLRELGKPEPVTATTPFAIASNTKAFTSASLSMLADEGKLPLAKVAEAIKKYAIRADKINPLHA